MSCVTLDIPAKAEYVVLGRLALAGLLRSRGFSDDAVADLKLALTEACSNSVRHAYDHDQRPGPPVVHHQRPPRHGGIRDEGGGFHEDDVDCPECQRHARPRARRGRHGHLDHPRRGRRVPAWTSRPTAAACWCSPSGATSSSDARPRHGATRAPRPSSRARLALPRCRPATRHVHGAPVWPAAWPWNNKALGPQAPAPRTPAGAAPRQRRSAHAAHVTPAQSRARVVRRGPRRGLVHPS